MRTIKMPKIDSDMYRPVPPGLRRSGSDEFFNPTVGPGDTGLKNAHFTVKWQLLPGNLLEMWK